MARGRLPLLNPATTTGAAECGSASVRFPPYPAPKPNPPPTGDSGEGGPGTRPADPRKTPPKEGEVGETAAAN